MSNPELERYNELYTKFVELVVQYHNRHQDFKAKITEIGAQDLRRMLRELRALEKEMGPLVWDIYSINKKGLAEVRRLKREERERKKLHPPPKGGRKKKIESKHE